jgi:hypothetical protein
VKWRNPSRRTQDILIAPIAIPTAALAAVIILPAVGVVWCLNAAMKPFRAGPEWARWFAWRPVYTGDIWDDDRRWIWLEMVERRDNGRYSPHVLYRAPGCVKIDRP